MAIEVPQLRRALFGYRTSSVDETLAKRDDEIHMLVAERNELAARLNEASTSLLAVRRELAELEAYGVSAEGWISHLEAQSEAATSRIRELEHRATDLGTRVLEERSRGDEAAGRLRGLEGELAHERARATAVAADLTVANERLASMEAALDERSREVERWRSDWLSTKEQLEASVRERDVARRLTVEAREREERLAAETAERRDRTDHAANPAERSSTSPGDVVAALEAAERTMLRIVEENRRRLTDDIEAAERRRDQVLHEVSRWEEHTGRLRTAGWRVAEAARETREAIGGVDEAIRTALQPLVGSLSILDEGVSVLDVDEPSGEPGRPRGGDTATLQADAQVTWGRSERTG